MRSPSAFARRRRWVAAVALALVPALGLFGRAPVPKSQPVPIAMLGDGPGRNMANLVDKGIPDKPDPEDKTVLKWKADLGSRSNCGPIIASGVVLMGTNNGRPRNARDVTKGPDGDEPVDKGVVMCFDEATGRFLWQAVHDKLPDRYKDWPMEGGCSAATIEGGRAYYVSNRCTVVCVELGGHKKGLKALVNSDDPKKKGTAYDTPADAGVVWELDMMKDPGVFPHSTGCQAPMGACNPLLVGDTLFVVTGNGVDETHVKLPSPNAPSFLAVDKKTGKVLWKRNDPGTNILHGQWGQPSYASAGGVRQVIFPGGDGWLYSFVPETGDLLWKFDANPKSATHDIGGTGDKNDFVFAAPVIVGDKLYIGTGQDPEHFTGVAHFYCIDLTKAVANAKKNKDKDVSPELIDKVVKGDGFMDKLTGKPIPLVDMFARLNAGDDGKDKVTGKPNPDSAMAWHYGGKDDRKFVPREFQFGRTVSSACVADGVVYITELSGYLHSLDAKTGKKFWQYDTKSNIYGSPYYVDGKVFVATDDGNLFAFKHSRTPAVTDDLDNPGATDQKAFKAARSAKVKQIEAANLLAKIEFDAAIRSTPVVANGVLYVMTEKTLYAFGKK